MRLWNDYEGRTIADVYPIEKLIRPEGRSAFFSTSNGTGIPAVIRLIESINDETEILNRWKTVSELNEDHLVKLKKFGQTVFEGTPLIYVLMESTEIDLASILQQGTLNVEETHQLATSLVEAVMALHASGIVHEHIEPINVLAKGEIVKLRSDCVRETPEGEEGIALMKGDVRDIAVVLLQALTQRKNLDALGRIQLTAPLEAVIRNGINGTWGLAQMAAALAPPAVKAAPAVAPPVTTGRTSTASASATGVTAAVGAATRPTRASQMPLEMPEAEESIPVRRVEKSQLQERSRFVVEDEEPRKRWWMAMVPAAVILLAAIGWHSYHTPASKPTPPIKTVREAEPAQEQKPAPTQNIAPMAAPTKPSAALQQPMPGGADVPRWKVIAFTYNHQDQAQHKVDELMQKDAALQPEVFSPHGGAPYLVTVGGTMTRADAVTFRQKAASEGLPQDIYIQNYEGRGARRSRRN